MSLKHLPKHSEQEIRDEFESGLDVYCNPRVILSGHDNLGHDHARLICLLLTTSLHYFYKKYVGATYVNLNFYLGVSRVDA